MLKGREVRHCSKGQKGKLIKRHKTKEKAVRQHRAIMANKRKGK